MTDSPVPMLDLKRQYASIKDEVDEAVRRVVESGYYASGPEAKLFEQEFAAYCGVAHFVAVGSGTAALNLTLRALGVGPGDEVATTGFTLSATLDAIVDTGARPVLVDVDPSTYTLDAHLLAKRISASTKAVLPVHVYGHPADMDAIRAVTEPLGLPIVGDCCEAHGALYKGRQVAAAATASCFSFYPTKNLNAMGDGGGIATDDAALAERIRLLRQHGWDKRFHSSVSSLNSRMDEIHAAVLRAKLPHLDAWNDRRREIAKRFDKALHGAGVERASRAEWAGPSYFLYVVRTTDRDGLRQALAGGGIATDVAWPEPPHLQPAFAHLGYAKGSLPVTERLCDEVVSIPMFAEMTDSEVERICAALRDFGRTSGKQGATR